MTPLALFAVDPAGTGGVVLRGPPGPERDRWLQTLRSLLPGTAPVRRVPLNISTGRLLGGLDLAATLQAGKPLAERGLLAEAHHGVILLAMAERLTPETAAHIAAVLDTGESVLQRDGLERRHPARIGVIALDEGLDDERLAPSLQDRLAFHLDTATLDEPETDLPAIEAARLRLPTVTVTDDAVETLCLTACALGIASLRAPLLALRAARAAAALAGRTQVLTEDVTLAAKLVLAPRATILPTASEPGPEPSDPAKPEPQPEDTPDPTQAGEMADIVLEAAAAAIPPGLLAQLAQSPDRLRHAPPGRRGPATAKARRGRPAGIRPGDPRDGHRLNLIETLRAAAPWQRVRNRSPYELAHAGPNRISIRREDFRVTHMKQHAETTTIFLVDASGSQAVNRLAEAKGAVELLLADCYIRRDQVAVIAFRGRTAELLLPPTRSLVRAKRSLAGLPGGGGTPLAHGIDAGCALADALRRRGGSPALILLTDARPNIGRDGKPGRPAAERDADQAARRIRAARHPALVVDTAPRPHPAGQRLATEMGARYLALPHATPSSLSQSVRTLTP